MYDQRCLCLVDARTVEQALAQRGHDGIAGALPAELGGGQDTRSLKPRHTNMLATATMRFVLTPDVDVSVLAIVW